MKNQPLRVHIVTEADPFYLPEFFREFFARLPREQFVVTGVDITQPLNQRTAIGLARKLYNFYGPIDFTRLGLRYLGVLALDACLPASVYAGSIRRIAGRCGVVGRLVSDVNAPEYVEGVRSLGPDLLVSVAASQIFRRDLLAVPRLDAINIHTGVLPEYRGMLPVFWQLYDRRDSIGITIHTMTVDIDLGEILLQRQVPVDGLKSLDKVIRKMKRQGAQALLDLLERYRSGSVTRTSMDRSRQSYHHFPGRGEAVAFRKMGLRLL